MKVLVAPDKFKGSMSAAQASSAMEKGLLDAWPDAAVEKCPMADGGEGTVEAVARASGARVLALEVHGPMPGRTVEAKWAMLSEEQARVLGAYDLPHGTAAVIELAQASGFSLVGEDRRDPLVATTFGTGQLIEDALERGCSSIVVGIGGSATVDGGTGMARALGYRFLDDEGEELPQGGGPLTRLARIDASGADMRIGATRFIVASDVENPLTGERGAARVFGPQKGAGAGELEVLEAGLERLAERMREDLDVNVLPLPGGGAAGGTGAALAAFCGATVTSGVDLVAAAVRLEERMRPCDLVLTGEGSFDAQTLGGKAPAGVLDMAQRLGIPAVVLAGTIRGTVESSLPAGSAAFSITPGPMPVEEAMARGEENLSSGTARLATLLTLLGNE